MAWQARKKHFKGGQGTSGQSYLDGHMHRPASIFAIQKNGQAMAWAAWAVPLGMHGTLLVVAQNNNFTVKWLE